jgi:hypothetical protein
MSAWPEPDRTETPRTPADERTSLDTWVDYHRATLLKKCAGLTPEQLARQSCPPSNLSLLGLVRHMTIVEPWFHAFDDLPRLELLDVYCTDEYPDGEFDLVDPAHAEEDLAAFHASVARSRAAVAGRGLDDRISDGGRPVSLRWAYQHMIEEYARHNGHADLLRERIDGVTGD